MNTNLMFSTGLSTAYGFSVLGSYQDPGGGADVGLADGGRGGFTEADHYFCL